MGLTGPLQRLDRLAIFVAHGPAEEYDQFATKKVGIIGDLIGRKFV